MSDDGIGQLAEQPNTTKTPAKSRWFTVLLAGLIMCGNHYARDAVGALERQIETDLSITTDQYAAINAFYFIPSIFAPLLAGVLTNYLGGAEVCLLYACISGAVGHTIFSLGIQSDSIRLIYIGRFLAGFMYEIIDSLPLVVLSPLFQSNWGLIVGLLNGFLRLGSVMNFIVTPIIYSSSGVKDALWFATALAWTTIVFATGIYLINRLNMADSRADNIYQQLDVSSHIKADDMTPIRINKEFVADTLSCEDIESCVSSGSGHHDILTLESSSYNDYSEDNTDSEFDDLPSLGSCADRKFSTPVTPKNSQEESEFEAKNPMQSFEISDSEKASPLSTNNNSMAISFFGYINGIRVSMGEALPLHLFSCQYYMFLASIAFLYGSMVPFWFLGSKFLQDNYSLSVGHADALMLFPEGMIAVVSAPMGIMLDRYNCSVRFSTQLYTCSCALLPLAYLMLAYGFKVIPVNLDTSTELSMGEFRSESETETVTLISPVLTMVAIGFAYSCSNSLYWSTIMSVLPKGSHFATANGLIASSLNVLPALVPPFLVVISSFYKNKDNISILIPLYVLSALGCGAAGFAYLASIVPNPLHSTHALDMKASALN